MKKIILLTMGLFLFGLTAFCQAEEENGTIYIKHAYIDVINNTAKAYLAKDNATLNSYYSDTAKFWASGMEKNISMADVIKHWNGDFDKYDDIKLTAQGYPDYLHYLDKDQKYVQSWWVWSGKSKKTGEVLTVPFVQFDQFNDDGKIDFEMNYGDFSKMDHD